MHSESPSSAERPPGLYRGSWEISILRMRWILVGLGIGSSLSEGDVSSLMERSSPSKEDGIPSWVESKSRPSSVICSCMHVSAEMSTRSGAAWRIPPPLEVLWTAA